MNRRTNLFYKTGNDSKFLTFDNYSEALTGDILATDWKLYPSRFLCIYIENLNKSNLIEYLTTYYENKLAFLRDKGHDEDLKPLNYLLECLILYAGEVNGATEYSFEMSDQLHKYILGNVNHNFKGIEFSYMSDIVEQDYNGTYADIICTITPNRRTKFRLVKNSEIVEDSLRSENYLAENTKDKLYGWQNDWVSDEMKDHVEGIGKVKLDKYSGSKEGYYYVESSINNIEEVLYMDDEELKFNIIVPLFDLTNINSKSVKILEETEEGDSSSTYILNNQKNVPLGIYFTDGTVELDKDADTKFSSNWSLLISMQFKSFPFSYDIKNSWDNSDSIKDAYLTFAQILSKQSDFMDLLNRYNELITGLQNKISKLESGVSNISSVQNIDELSQRINELSNKLNTKMNEVDAKIKEMEDYVDNSKLKWAIKTGGK